MRRSATRARSLSRQVLLLVRCAADVTRLWQRVEQNRFPRLREVSMSTRSQGSAWHTPKAACEVGADGHSKADRDACAPAGDDTGVAAVKVKGPAGSSRKVEAGSRAEFSEQAIDYQGGAGHVAG